MNLRRNLSETTETALDFSRLFDGLPGLFMILDTAFNIVAVNRAYARATLIRPKEAVGRALFDVFPDNPDDRQADGVRNLKQSLDRVLQTGRADAMDIQRYDVRDPEGVFEERYWSCINAPLHDASGRLGWIIHRAEDVTELARLKRYSEAQNQIARDLTRAIEELRVANSDLFQAVAENESLVERYTFLAKIVEGSGSAIVGITRDGVITSWNSATERLFGYSEQEVVGRPVSILFPPETIAADRDVLARVLNGEFLLQLETVRLHKDGRRLNVVLTVSPLYDPKGQVIAASAIIRDVTAERQAEKELANAQLDRLFLADLVESTTDAVVARTNDGRIRNWNHAAEKIFGFTAAEMVGSRGRLSAALEAEDQAAIERLLGGEPNIHYESVRPAKDGRNIDVFITASLIRNQQGEIIGTSKILRDITEPKRLEARTLALQSELEHLDRLSAMGQMSASIAHEMKQPLAAIVNYASAATRALEGEQIAAKNLGQAREAMVKTIDQALRADTILRSLRGYAEKRPALRTQEDINDVIREAAALAMLGPRPRDLKLHLTLDPQLAPMIISKVQIQQVLLNLIRNAVEAMAQTAGPELTVSSAAGASVTKIMVRDNGPGFSPEVQEKMFQPFVTTKADGMGLGLKVCRSIIEAHGGTIAAEKSASGAVLAITLPTSGSEEGDMPGPAV